MNINSYLLPQMVDDSDLRLADRVLRHLGEVEKTYKLGKKKDSRDRLLHFSLSDDTQELLEEVWKYMQDKRVCEVFRDEATSLLQGHISRTRYTRCLGLLTARLMLA